MKHLPLKVLVTSAVLAALSATLQLIHIGYQSPQWGMWIDIVAVSWLIAFFLYGMRSALIVTASGFLVITLFAPDTWLGAIMKASATLPIFAALFTYLKWRKASLSIFSSLKHLVIPLIVGCLTRSLIIIPVNYYFAIPIWTKMTQTAAMTAIPWFIIAGFNTVQTVVDVGLAWILVYKLKLNRYIVKEETHE